MNINLEFELENVSFFAEFDINVKDGKFDKIFNRTLTIQGIDENGDDVFIGETKKRELISYMSCKLVKEINELI